MTTRHSRLGTLVVTLLYSGLTLVLTWPLARGIARDVPGDFGDPLFSAWVMAWDATHLGRGWWSANIFAPHPLALAYSEHFLPQAIAALPFYAVTGNPLLGYNLVFLSTFVLSALGMFLFAREMTRSTAAAFVAGLAFAFAPYRIASIPHLQVLSAAWMPFVLFGLRRHFDTRRVAPLIGAAAAWTMQNLSCGYYFFFFSPVVVAYIAWEVWRRGWTRDRGALTRLAIAGAAVAAATVPFLLPYVELRRLGFGPRSIVETRRFSADVYAYFTADPNLRLWGPILQAWPHAEGLLFPGFTIVGLASIGAWSGMRPRRWLAAAATALCVALAGWLLLGYAIRLPFLKITSLSRLSIAVAAAAALALASPGARAAVSAWLRRESAWLLLVAVFAIAMSFGPDIRAMGREVAASNLYALFYRFVPGFDGLRVPARFAMIGALALAGLSALGVESLVRRFGPGAALAAGALIAVEAWAVPIPINQSSTDYADKSLAPLAASIGVDGSLPAIYSRVRELPQSAVLLELPLGEPAFDVRYMFYSTTHWRRLVNGYSGGAPADYQVLVEALKDAKTRPARAWQEVMRSAATHVIVHQSLYRDDGGARVSSWLRASGAHEVAAAGSDRIFAVR